MYKEFQLSLSISAEMVIECQEHSIWNIKQTTAVTVTTMPHELPKCLSTETKYICVSDDLDILTLKGMRRGFYNSLLPLFVVITCDVKKNQQLVDIYFLSILSI